MVSRGPRPEHRKGTTGRPWRRFRRNLVDVATNCAYCSALFVRDAPCTHPTHRGLSGCPTHTHYPTLEHPHALVDGGAVRDRGNALVVCYGCNARMGAYNRHSRTAPTPLQW